MENSKNTPAFYFLAWISFLISSFGVVLGIVFMEGVWFAKAFFTMAYLFSLSSCFMVAKVVRDKQEEESLTKKIEKAKTQHLINKYVDTSE
ncbi:MAG: hypothetical protein EAZ85_06260 [Bacteroidetes bacterium]|nr:MAG: hypothetical protein EAZ85_06260 [Bacteroidota bacterium]TAG94029.1 MAG: hypothetical protein EAZ20_01230 [Bacteroidota bacterium]